MIQHKVSAYKKQLLCACLLFLLSSPITAQSGTYIKSMLPDLSSKTTQTEPVKKITTTKIGSIQVKGAKSLDESTIITASGLKVGDSYNRFKKQRAKSGVKQLGIFKSINITAAGSADKQNITIYVEENPIISDIQFNGVTAYTRAFLDEYIQSKANEPVNLNSIRKDIQFIESSYDNDGFMEAKLYHVDRPKADNEPLVFHVAEGVIEDIVLTGNNKTQAYVILREMDLRPGDLIIQKDIASDIRKIFNLNYFENIIPDLIPGKNPHHYVLHLTIVERESSGAFSFGGGYAPNSGFSVFSDLYWDNLMGTGQLIMLKGNFGLGTSGFNNSNSTYQFKFHNPWAFGKRRSLTLRTWVTKGSLSTFNFGSSDFTFTNQTRRGFDVAVGVPHSYDVRSTHKVKYESVALHDSDLFYNIYSYAVNLGVDKRDQRLNPRSGYYHNLSIENGFRFRLSAIDFTQVDITLRKFIPLFTNQTIALRTKLGYIRSPQIDNEDLFAAQYYYVGGSRSVRGYPDNSPFANGDSQILGTLEYRVILSTNLTVYGFSDVGYASRFLEDGEYVERSFKDLSNYKLTKGIGVKFVLQPLGPIKLDFGVTEEGVGRLQFNLGYVF